MVDARTLRRILAVASAALLLGACSDAPQTVFDPAGPFAQRPDDLWQLVFWIAVGVFVVVQGLIIYAIWRFRQRPGEDDLPVQVHGNTRLEILWTVIPALILAGIAVPTVQTIFDLDRDPDGSMAVEVIGHRWWFEYRYPDHDIVTANELVIPAGQPVRLSMTAEESGGPTNAVIHSWWVPQLAGKQDVIPGRTTTLNVQADEPGKFQGQCAEYCGLSHANMRIRVTALPRAEFEQWVADQQAPAAEPEEGTLAAEGKEVFFSQACVACHTLDGTSFTTADGEELTAQSIVGPNLTHLMSREWFAGATFELTEENLARWLENPPAMKPMRATEDPSVGMPDLGLTPEEVEALVAYLMTLR